MQFVYAIVLALALAATGTALINPTTADAASNCSDADINRDRVVDDADYQILLANYGQTGRRVPGDLNDDGVVNAFDYTLLLNEYGKDCRTRR